ncbi:MAG: dethiobiotin synthase [Fluviicola sp. XM-24bin1]|nr:MAG: dethiobiotin synthase [Fluviicola sp. XM-24bin1]
MQKYIITGIGTEVGKTVVSAIVSEALRANYWKPVQAGDLDFSDSMKVDAWTDNVNILEERYRLKTPMSPHAAADIDGISIASHDFQVPDVNPLVIEGAGGLMVPLNQTGLTYLDVFQKWNLPVILVSRHYLGSINHTLMSVDALKQRGIEIKGIIFVGDEHPTTESIILKSTGLPMIIRIPMTDEVNKDFVMEQAKRPEFLYSL